MSAIVVDALLLGAVRRLTAPRSARKVHHSGISPYSTRSIGLSTLTGGPEASSGVRRSTWVKDIGVPDSVLKKG